MIQRERDLLLTEKMALLQNMLVADRMISFGLLTAGLSQHIRNPLVAVKTFLDLAPARMKEEKAHVEGLRHPDFWHEFHQNVPGQLDKIDHLLKDLWTASEKPAPEFADRVRLHAIIEETLARLKQAFAAKDIQVESLVSVENAPARGRLYRVPSSGSLCEDQERNVAFARRPIAPGSSRLSNGIDHKARGSRLSRPERRSASAPRSSALTQIERSCPVSVR